MRLPVSMLRRWPLKGWPLVAAAAIGAFAAACPSRVVQPTLRDGALPGWASEQCADEPLPYRAGELLIEQAKFQQLAQTSGSPTFIVGTDGQIAMLDVGSLLQVREVRARIRELNSQIVAAGLGPRAPMQLEWILLTHYHPDHLGGLVDLVDPTLDSNALVGLKGVVHRGVVDLSNEARGLGFTHWCRTLRGLTASQQKALCHRATPVTCWDDGQVHAATDCNGLVSGNLETTADDASGEPAYVALGDARITLFAGNFHVVGRDGVVKVPFEDPYRLSDHENGRSLAGLVTLGGFRYHFGGDLTGGGPGNASGEASPDMERAFMTHVRPGPYAGGVDVLQVHHHGYQTSTSEAFLHWVLPKSGTRNAVAGISDFFELIGVGSVAVPQKVPTERILAHGLGGGRYWVTEASAEYGPIVVDAHGSVLIRTEGKGAGYWVQAPHARSGSTCGAYVTVPKGP